MVERKFEIDLGDIKLIAELGICNLPERAPGICIFLQDKKTGGYQDICMVNPDMNGKEFAQGKTPERMECLVWGNEYDEGYTESYSIPVYKEPDDEEV